MMPYRRPGHRRSSQGTQTSGTPQAGRAYSRDYVDTAALLGRWTPAELIGFARRLDPGLDSRDLADVALRLDQMPDTAFAPFGLSPENPDQYWPRTINRVPVWYPPKILSQPAGITPDLGQRNRVYLVASVL